MTRGAGAVLPDWLHVDGEADGAHGVGQVDALPVPGVQLPDYRGHLDTSQGAVPAIPPTQH